jgi:O-antigen/teichoic acid export membrane protein
VNAYKKLLSNSFLFAIGNLGSKIILFILVPLYTYYLTTAEYGFVDIVTTTTNLLLPILSANVFEAVLRFAMDKEESQSEVLSNSLLVGGLGALVAVLLYPLLALLKVDQEMLNYIYVILILQVFQNIFSQFARALGEIKVFAINGIWMTLVMSIANVVLLTRYHMGIAGYLLSIVIANIASILYLIVAVKIWKYMSLSSLNKPLVKKMLAYAVPIIPNSIMWWLINASNRYFILGFLTASANGIYAVSNKIPGILSIVTSIFTQSWQLSAIEEYESEHKSEFYSKVFNYYSSLLFLGTSGILVILKFFMAHFIAPEYYEAWQSVPFLLLSVVFSSFSSFLGTNYLAAKETRGVFRTSVYGGLASLLLNFLLIPFFGLIGAAVASMLSFAIMWVLRIFDTKRYIDTAIDAKNMIMNLALTGIQIGILFLNLKYEVLMEMTLFILQFINNRTLLSPLKGITKKMNKNKE